METIEALKLSIPLDEHRYCVWHILHSTTIQLMEYFLRCTKATTMMQLKNAMNELRKANKNDHSMVG